MYLYLVTMRPTPKQWNELGLIHETISSSKQCYTGGVFVDEDRGLIAVHNMNLYLAT